MKKSTQKYARKFSILLSAFILINSMGSNHINKYIGSDANVLKELRKQYTVKIKEDIPNPKEDDIFLVSAYNLSYQSTQKSRGSTGYGITSEGFDLRCHTLASARVIAVDPNIIPMHSKVKLTFKDVKYKKYDGIYNCLDKGGLIKGKKIDLFFGDYHGSDKMIKDFGVTICEIEIIKED